MIPSIRFAPCAGKRGTGDNPGAVLAHSKALKGGISAPHAAGGRGSKGLRLFLFAAGFFQPFKPTFSRQQPFFYRSNSSQSGERS
jgi:hypothetical protein